MRKFYVLAVFFIFILGKGTGQVKWTEARYDHLWTTGSNWSTNTIPSATDNVILDNSNITGDYTVILPGNATVQTVKSLQMGYCGNT